MIEKLMTQDTLGACDNNAVIAAGGLQGQPSP